jgi:hypothetical protein
VEVNVEADEKAAGDLEALDAVEGGVGVHTGATLFSLNGAVTSKREHPNMRLLTLCKPYVNPMQRVG